MRLAYAPYMLHFRRPAGTSRGVLMQKPTCFIKVWNENDPSRYGIGEAALFPGLSPECGDFFGQKMIELLANVALGRSTDLSQCSSIQYGFEQALLNFTHGCDNVCIPSAFTAPDSSESIPINGLIWMGSKEYMLEQIREKMRIGFRCIKLKIGAVDWDTELSLVKMLRDECGDSLVIRVDANGAFTEENVRSRLDDLARYRVHSIEQPVKPECVALLASLCADTPVPIALDESLIGVSGHDAKTSLLTEIKPQYIILKPALCGGFSGAAEWIEMAREMGIGWWVTSALESNIGLNALAQWTASLPIEGAQGLGTGALYTDNLPSPLVLDGERLRFDASYPSIRDVTDKLDWRW